MKKVRNKKIIVLFLILLSALFFIFLNFYRNSQKKSSIKNKITISPTKSIQKTSIKSTSIFIPYWNIENSDEKIDKYDRLIYFGIAPSYEGINKNETGYLHIEKFNSMVPNGKKKYLTLRMIDDDLNTFILENKNLREKVIDQTLDIIRQNKFVGLVLDLEISNTLNEDLKVQINAFVQKFYSEANKHYRKFIVAIYGDTFFRVRPFDPSFLGKNSDEIMIMAYDFHKSRGEPGPNFPLESGPKYSYNFKLMIEDFLKFVPKEKLTVVFGMFGYDWLVDEKKRPIRQAKALSLNEINKNFVEKCEFKNCVIKRDEISKESEINYIISSPTPDEQLIYRIDYHIVWFEDEESVKAKTNYLKELGISSIAYWAHGYF